MGPETAVQCRPQGRAGGESRGPVTMVLPVTGAIARWLAGAAVSCARRRAGFSSAPAIALQPAMAAPLDARVLITQCQSPAGPVGDDGRPRHFVHLRHPVTGAQACYVVGPDGRLHELNWSKQRHTAWFIANSICADGSLYLATPIDPLYVILPVLEQLRMKKGDDMGKFRSLGDIVSVDGYPGYECILPYLQRSLEIICEAKEVDEIKYYRLDDSKVLAWLVCKMIRLSEALKSSSGLFHGLLPNELNIYVIKMLGEYIKMDPWMSPICKYMGVDMDALKTVRVPFMPSMPASLRTPESKGNKLNGPAAKKAALSKNSKDTGARKITSFFAKPR